MWGEGVNIRGGQEGDAYNPGGQGGGTNHMGQFNLAWDWTGQALVTVQATTLQVSFSHY
jgi:hypothetical protein